MNIISDASAMQSWARDALRSGKRTALVPTMGNLHEGHLSLVRLARREADRAVVSLFVNPTQFGPGEDYTRYPRTFMEDAEKCRAENVDILFAPDESGMYAADHSTCITEDRLSAGLCGAARPGHFRGVCTVVAKLFHLVRPDVAVFGEKDLQQWRVIERMVRDLSFPVRIVPCPIVREPDGLALSSRNRYLTAREREQAPCLFAALIEAHRLHAAGEHRADRLCAAAGTVLARAPEAQVEYLAVVDDQDLQPVTAAAAPTRMLLAVRFGKTRLIDNIRLG